MSRNTVQELADKDTINILIATDNHLGYEERDPICGQDSFYAFEEIMQIAHEKQADMVLLAGDLFHYNRPSRKCIYESFRILRKYALNDKPCALEYLSNPQTDFGDQFDSVNYEDPNINIGLPIFTIHGNHDDPCGEGNLSAIDILSETRFINYFGKNKNVDQVKVSPVMLRKGDTYLALYGLGNIRDERLHRTFKGESVTFEPPPETLPSPTTFSKNGKIDWFNLLAIHQNRVPHGPSSHIPEKFLEDFLHLVIWGHEHECLIDPEESSEAPFYVSQPGSSVATSLSVGEAKPKYIGILKIHKQEFSVEKIRLKNVRPFVIHDVSLDKNSTLYDPMLKKGLEKYLQHRIDTMIKDAKSLYKIQLKESQDYVPAYLGSDPKPLIRIRVEYTEELDSFYPHRFALSYSDRVANPKDILLFKRPRTEIVRESNSCCAREIGDTPTKHRHNSDDNSNNLEAAELYKVEDLVKNHLNTNDLQLLIDMEMSEAVKQFVDKGDTSVIQRYVAKSLKEIQDELSQSIQPLCEEAELIEELRNAQLLKINKILQDSSGSLPTIDSINGLLNNFVTTEKEDEDSDNHNENESEPEITTTTAKNGRSTKTVRTATKRKAHVESKEMELSDQSSGDLDHNDIEEEERTNPLKRKKTDVPQLKFPRTITTTTTTTTRPTRMAARSVKSKIQSQFNENKAPSSEEEDSDESSEVEPTLVKTKTRKGILSSTTQSININNGSDESDSFNDSIEEISNSDNSNTENHSVLHKNKKRKAASATATTKSTNNTKGINPGSEGSPTGISRGRGRGRGRARGRARGRGGSTTTVGSKSRSKKASSSVEANVISSDSDGGNSNNLDSGFGSFSLKKFVK
ncbi:meiotic recombination [Mycoemilia scoparia]|uniref:Meiotic recombination n=1 Tax=Mycoemilia scoparia TaxID=417184 RepID=A0A9W7ZQK6_9FUNG|nr:meiotic recombination [Mycoemilia scoparia]